MRFYVLLVAAGLVTASFCTIYFVVGTLRAGRIIHERLVASISIATFRSALDSCGLHVSLTPTPLTDGWTKPLAGALWHGALKTYKRVS